MVFRFIYTWCMGIPEKFYLRCDEAPFSSLNWEVMLWQQERESKGWKDKVEFETQNLWGLNRFQIWKLAFSQPQCTWQWHQENNSGENRVIVRVVSHIPFWGHAQNEVNRFHLFPSERGNPCWPYWATWIWVYACSRKYLCNRRK